MQLLTTVEENARSEAQRQLRNAWGAWVGTYPWRHYATLTDSNSNSPRSLVNHSKAFVRRLESRGGGRVDYIAIVEGAHRGFPHLHMLLNGTERLTTREIQRQWRLGLSEIRRYNPARAAAYYLVKELGRSYHDPDLFDFRLPRPAGAEPSHPDSAGRRAGSNRAFRPKD